MTWAEYLNLPPGWAAAEYVATVELRGPQDWQYGAIPKPMDPMPKDWWLACAGVIVKRPAFPMAVAESLPYHGRAHVFITEDHEHVICTDCNKTGAISGWEAFLKAHAHPDLRKG